MRPERRPDAPVETLLATSLQVLERLMRQHGVEPRSAFVAAGIDPALLVDPRARVPADALDRLIGGLVERIADPAFGLDAARCWHPTNFGAVGHAWLASSTLRRGLQRLARYWQLIGQRTALTLRAERGCTAVVLDNPRRDPALAAVTTDIVLSVLLDLCRFNAGRTVAPTEVRLIRPRPPQTERYETFFAAPIRYGCPERALVFDDDALDAPLPTSNRELVGVLETMLAEELARLARGDVVARARAVLLRRLPSGEVSVADAARELAMSRRTLHRRLAEAGAHWQQLVDDTRHELALRLIDDRRRSIGELTFELGFSQQSAFARAFKRWTGASPSAFRARPGATAPPQAGAVPRGEAVEPQAR